MNKTKEGIRSLTRDQVISWVAPGTEAFYLRLGHEVGYTHPSMIALGVVASVLIGLYFSDFVESSPSTLNPTN